MAYISFQPSDYFNTKLYTGNGSTQSISSVGFQPDLVWCKDRTNSYDHVWFDAVRSATKRIVSNTSGAETTASTDLTAFDSDGFTVGSGSNINNSGNNFASWNWKANGSGSSNTDGSITSTVSANTTSGFSIVSYTGTGANATVGHGLGVAPKMIIFKNRSSVKSWATYHSSIGATKFLFLNETTTETTYSATFNDTEPTSSVFSVGTDLSTNVSSDNYVAYCFAEKKGYSKFSSYIGNGSTDGTFIYTGFKPAWFLWKRTDSADSWNLVDSKRIGYNPDNNRLFPNLTSAEDTQDRVDLVSNGIKIRTSDVGTNASGGSYIYMAFAEHPLVSSNDIPATAR